MSTNIIEIEEKELSGLKLETFINGILTQEENIDNMLFNAYKSLSYINVMKVVSLN
jgi:hypothetical protein